jgi:hypothetical protein
MDRIDHGVLAATALLCAVGLLLSDKSDDRFVAVVVVLSSELLPSRQTIPSSDARGW